MGEVEENGEEIWLSISQILGHRDRLVDYYLSIDPQRIAFFPI
jgi:hypothetical protein